MIKLDMPLGRQLRLYRELKGVSQEQLADLMDTNQAQISDIEGGKVDPRWTTIERYLKALGFKGIVVPLPDVQQLLSTRSDETT